MNFGERLQKLRISRSLSVSDMARKLSISLSTYRDWEYGRGIRGEPYILMAKVLKVSLSELLTGKKPSLDIKLAQIEEIVKNIREEA